MVTLLTAVEALGLDTKNLSLGVHEKQWRIPACASVQTDQHLCYSLIN